MDDAQLDRQLVERHRIERQQAADARVFYQQQRRALVVAVDLLRDPRHEAAGGARVRRSWRQRTRVVRAPAEGTENPVVQRHQLARLPMAKRVAGAGDDLIRRHPRTELRQQMRDQRGAAAMHAGDHDGDAAAVPRWHAHAEPTAAAGQPIRLAYRAASVVGRYVSVHPVPLGAPASLISVRPGPSCAMTVIDVGTWTTWQSAASVA